MAAMVDFPFIDKNETYGAMISMIRLIPYNITKTFPVFYDDQDHLDIIT